MAPGLSAQKQKAEREKKSAKIKTEEATSLPKYTDDFLDTVKLDKKFMLNDYTLIGVEYGVSQRSMLFTPSFNRKPIRFPDFYGITYTRYGKTVATLPHFAFQLGLFYGHAGSECNEHKETGAISVIENATKVTYDVIEMPLLCAFHADMTHFKVMADVGPYAGYRLNIHRSGPFAIEPSIKDNFTSYDRRIEYGLHGGGGFALIYAPVEFHVKLRVRYSWSSIFEPDYNSPYYYRYGYPLDFMLTAGVHFQLTKRYGKTKAMVRREAKNMIYNPEPPTTD